MAAQSISEAQQGAGPQRNGVGVAIGHHGELLQGVFEDKAGRLHRGLVTLPLARLVSRASFTFTGSLHLVVEPRHKTKASAAARLTLKHLRAEPGGQLNIFSDIPVGHGFGSSTADVVATIRAVAAACQTPLLPASISRLAVAAELASDAIAFENQALLFAQREGVVVEDFGGALPPLLVVSCKAIGGQPVNTLQMQPARYDSAEIQQFGVLNGLIARAVRQQDPDLLGRAATASARINQRKLPKEGFEQVLAIAESAGACGVQVAHSGSLIGILFDRTDTSLRRRSADTATALQRAGFQDLAVHHVNDDGAPW